MSNGHDIVILYGERTGHVVISTSLVQQKLATVVNKNCSPKYLSFDLFDLWCRLGLMISSMTADKNIVGKILIFKGQNMFICKGFSGYAFKFHSEFSSVI